MFVICVAEYIRGVGVCVHFLKMLKPTASRTDEGERSRLKQNTKQSYADTTYVSGPRWSWCNRFVYLNVGQCEWIRCAKMATMHFGSHSYTCINQMIIQNAQIYLNQQQCRRLIHFTFVDCQQRRPKCLQHANHLPNMSKCSEMLRPVIRAPCERNAIIITIYALNRFSTTTRTTANRKLIQLLETFELLETRNVKIDTSNVNEKKPHEKHDFRPIDLIKFPQVSFIWTNFCLSLWTICRTQQFYLSFDCFTLFYCQKLSYARNDEFQDFITSLLEDGFACGKVSTLCHQWAAAGQQQGRIQQ